MPGNDPGTAPLALLKYGCFKSNLGLGKEVSTALLQYLPKKISNTSRLRPG